MLNFFRPSENEKLQNAMEYLANLAPGHTVVVEKKEKHTVWIVLAVVVALAAVGFFVYKFFFADTCDCYDDFDDFDEEYEYEEIFEDDDLEEPVVEEELKTEME